MTLARELAARVVATSFEDVGEPAKHYAKIGLLDTIAVGIAGADDDAARIARRVVGGSAGQALVWGTGERIGCLEAAFVNGVAANVLDFDDCTDNLGGHPSSPILPALIGLAEELGASGRDVLTAYVVGFEIETCLGRGVNFHHYEKGWHPTATLGVFGAAAACAKLMGLDEQRTTHALGLCASLAAGVKSNLGSMAKPMHVGNCSRNGLMAAQLAAEGFTSNADALEHHQGFLEVFNGAGHYDIGRILAKWGTPWDIEMPGIAIKQYPCCLSTQAVVDAMIRLARDHDLRLEGVARIDLGRYHREHRFLVQVRFRHHHLQRRRVGFHRHHHHCPCSSASSPSFLGHAQCDARPGPLSPPKVCRRSGRRRGVKNCSLQRGWVRSRDPSTLHRLCKRLPRRGSQGTNNRHLCGSCGKRDNPNCAPLFLCPPPKEVRRGQEHSVCSGDHQHHPHAHCVPGRLERFQPYCLGKPCDHHQG